MLVCLYVCRLGTSLSNCSSLSIFAIFASLYLFVCLCFCLSVCLFVFLSVCVSVCMCVCLSMLVEKHLLSVRLFVCLCVCLYIYLHVSLCVYLSVCLSIHLSVFVCLSESLSVCLSVSLSSVHLSVSASMFMPYWRKNFSTILQRCNAKVILRKLLKLSPNHGDLDRLFDFDIQSQVH